MSVAAVEPTSPEPAPGTIDLARYFLRLGSTGFGGPIALAGAMQRDLVENRRWITPEQYLDGLALAQLMPGPLAAQLAIYIGWVRKRWIGATVVATAFVLPSFLMVFVLAMLYLRYGGMPWVSALFYGAGPAMIGVVTRGAIKLARLCLGVDPLLWLIFLANTAATAWTGREEMWAILAAGALTAMIRGRSAIMAGRALGSVSLWGWLSTGIHGPASADVLARIAWHFTQAGALIFGSGLAIVPFLKTGVVDHMRWIGERQFMDAVAIGMITPGPVVITVAFIGYLVAGPLGAGVATLAAFVPCYLLVVLPAPHFTRFARNPGLRQFVSGVTAAAAGAIAGAVIVLGRRAVIDLPTAGLLVGALAAMRRWPKLPEPLWILLAGAAGLMLRGGRS